ncbi:WD repeat-containing protein 44 [Sorochytrium milnesiophthora]
MTDRLPPNLAKLFQPRPPLSYLRPLDRDPAKRRGTVLSGIGEIAYLLRDYDKDYVPHDTAETKRAKKIEERDRKAKEHLETQLAAWDPQNVKDGTENPYHTLFVGRLSYDTTEDTLRKEFERYGPLKTVKLIKVHGTEKSRGYAFLEFEREQDLKAAYKDADAMKLDGKRIVVDVERGRTVSGWRPRRLGGGLGSTRVGGKEVNQRHPGRDVPALVVMADTEEDTATAVDTVAAAAAAAAAATAVVVVVGPAVMAEIETAADMADTAVMAVVAATVATHATGVIEATAEVTVVSVAETVEVTVEVTETGTEIETEVIVIDQKTETVEVTGTVSATETASVTVIATVTATVTATATDLAIMTAETANAATVTDKMSTPLAPRRLPSTQDLSGSASPAASLASRATDTTTTTNGGDSEDPKHSRNVFTALKKKASHLFSERSSNKSVSSDDRPLTPPQHDYAASLSLLPTGFSHVKAKTGHKSLQRQFDHLLHVQTLRVAHQAEFKGPTGRARTVSTGSSRSLPPHMANTIPGPPVWVVRFSRCGRYLATGGQDAVLRVWIVHGLLAGQDGEHNAFATPTSTVKVKFHKHGSVLNLSELDADDFVDDDTAYTTLPSALFVETPFQEYRGHAADIVDITWSKGGFLASSSLDHSVRLWHPSYDQCLCVFQHNDLDDRYLLTTSWDSRLRLWSVDGKRIVSWADLSPQKLTASTFSSDGKLCIIGTYSGFCLFYETEGLKYHTQISVDPQAPQSARQHSGVGNTAASPNAQASSSGRKLRKITGLEMWPDKGGAERLLITSNDSRVRLYLVRDKGLECKYRGLVNKQMQIKASFSNDGRYIVCGSEDGCAYIWRVVVDDLHTADRGHHHHHSSLLSMFGIGKHDPGDQFESFEVSSQPVTATVFAPIRTSVILENAGLLSPPAFEGPVDAAHNAILVTADYYGVIRIFLNVSSTNTDPQTTSSAPASARPAPSQEFSQRSSVQDNMSSLSDTSVASGISLATVAAAVNPVPPEKSV